jgi:CheY-like chemotaxis protein
MIEHLPLRALPDFPSVPPFLPEPFPNREVMPQTPGRILVVEDDYFVGLLIEEALTDAGYDVLAVVTTGEEAVQKGSEWRPDLVLMDIRLAGEMSGVAAAVELRQRGISSVFASAHTDHGTRSAGEGAGPAGWLTKPFTSSEVVSTVAAALSKLRDQ